MGGRIDKFKVGSVSIYVCCAEKMEGGYATPTPTLTNKIYRTSNVIFKTFVFLLCPTTLIMTCVNVVRHLLMNTLRRKHGKRMTGRSQGPTGRFCVHYSCFFLSLFLPLASTASAVPPA